MYFGLSDDQIFFQDNVKKFLEDNAPLDIIRKISSDDDKTSKDDLQIYCLNRIIHFKLHGMRGML